MLIHRPIRRMDANCHVTNGRRTRALVHLPAIANPGTLGNAIWFAGNLPNRRQLSILVENGINYVNETVRFILEEYLDSFGHRTEAYFTQNPLLQTLCCSITSWSNQVLAVKRPKVLVGGLAGCLQRDSKRIDYGFMGTTTSVLALVQFAESWY